MISQQVANRNANANKNSGRSNNNRNNSPSNTGSNQSSSSTTSRLTDTEKAALMKEGKCFYCREQGHVSRSCPKKKDPVAALASATPRDSDKRNKVTADLVAAEESSDSKKEHA